MSARRAERGGPPRAARRFDHNPVVQTGPRRRLRRALLLAIPPLFFLALHARTLPYGFVWMDEGEIVRETVVRPLERLPRALVEPLFTNLDAELANAPQPFYRPLQVIAASLVHALAGKQPAAFRALSLALGALTCALFTALAAWLLRSPGAALFAGLVAAAHPAGLEVYVWIAGLSEALVDLFVLACFGAFLLYRVSTGSRARGGWAALSLGALLLALLSKENGAATPLLCLAGAVALEGAGARAAGEPWARRVRRAALDPVVLTQGALAVGFLALWRPWVLGSMTGGASWIGGDPLTQWRSALAFWPDALGWLALPLRSNSSDSVRVVTEYGDAAMGAGVALALASAVGGALLLWRGRPLAALGLAWIWIAFLPTAGLIPAVHARGERYLHLSVYGWALLLADLGPAALARLPRGARTPLALAAAAALVAGLAQRSWARSPDWRSTRALFERDLAADPTYREGRYQLAQALYDEGRAAEAAATLEPLVRPGAESARQHGFLREGNAVELYCIAQLGAGRHEEARAFAAAQRPDLAARPRLRFCRALAEELSGRPELALDSYRALLAEGAGESEPALRLALARSHLALGQRAEAERWLAGIDQGALRDPALDAQLRELRRRLRALAPRP